VELTEGQLRALFGAAIHHLCLANQIECKAKPDLFAISQLAGGAGAQRLRRRSGGRHNGFLKVAARAQIETTTPEYAFALAEAIQRARKDREFLKQLAEKVSAVSEKWDPKVGGHTTLLNTHETKLRIGGSQSPKHKPNAMPTQSNEHITEP
jgi:hypothetical protein